MIARLLGVLLLLIPAVALPQGYNSGGPGLEGGKVLWQAAFATPGCYASGQTAGASSAISITRTTSATYIDGNGDLQTCTAGQFRVAPDGLLVEPARTQFILNNSTHPKTGEATGSISAQACVGWHDGTGTMTIAAGTATVTGLSCTAVAAGTLCPFTVTVAGTMAVTTTAGTTRAQIECPGSYRTSFIPSAGTSAARNADQVSATVPAVPSKWCIAVTAKPEEGRAWEIGTNVAAMWSLGATGTANSSALYADVHLGSGVYQSLFRTYDSSVAARYIAANEPSPGQARIVACDSAGQFSLTYDGVAQTPTASVTTGSGLFATPPTALRFGDLSDGSVPFGGFLKNLKICKATKTKECP